MANSNELKNVEPYVREWLADKYRTEFEEKELPLHLTTGGQHKFDIVSKDRSIIGGVKAHSARANGRAGVGAIKSNFTELYFLSLVKAEKKILVLTNKGFYDYFSRIATGKVLPDTEILYYQLPDDLNAKVAEFNKSASEEMIK